ncbi:MAG: tetraacyldisaccharide 4'-kinase [Sphingobacteriales bacterium]|nr:tetraacyldisaccharide 4'-kinase [Sphingobacteriales bacterium]
MNLANLTFQSIRLLLLPFALIYWLVIWVRNKLYDKNILKSSSFNLPLICVGNLSVGGTGKSPMVEYLLRLLHKDFHLAAISRGYKRKTKGYLLANATTTSLEIGDEPKLFHIKFPTVAVAVGEERIVAIPQLLQDKPETEAIILDDAFQHRAVKAGLNILLTDYNNLFTRDFYLPTGDLRDLKSCYERATVIVVTKCPLHLSVDEKQSVHNEINPLPGQHIFFAAIDYGKPYHLVHNNAIDLGKEMEILLVTGIANPGPLKALVGDITRSYENMSFNDHHIFTIDDLRDIRKRFEKMEAQHKIILTTEKDAIRLVKFKEELSSMPLFVIPIQHKILFEESPAFNSIIINFIRNFKQTIKE